MRIHSIERSQDVLILTFFFEGAWRFVVKWQNGFYYPSDSRQFAFQDWWEAKAFGLLLIEEYRKK